MRLVSFDVGLRNLAFCVMEGTTRSNVKILHWDLIDVMAESAGHDGAKCFKCKKPANYGKQDGTLYACKTHCPKGSKAVTKTSLNKRDLEALKSDAKKEGIDAKTKKELVELLYRHYSANVWKRCVKSSKSMSVVDLADPIAQCLEARKELWKDADLIAFEQQPDKRMLCVQAMLHMWYVCQGYKCKGISATHKLTNMITLEDSTKTYKGRKKTGILHAQQLVPTIELQDYMMKHPKKDDLADCFLQGLWVLENHH
jgi:hypothetical protein